MAETDNKRVIMDIAVKFAELIGREMKLNRVILYGSFTRDNQHADSDIDIAVVSPDFTGDRLEDQFRLMKHRRSIDLRIEPIPFRPEEFVPEDPFVREILETGIIIL